VFYHDNRGLQDGALLHAGSSVLKDTYCANQTTETTPTAENYFHITYGDAVCKSQKNFQDYGTATVDGNGTDLWLAHAYATASGFKMVAGKVTP
jgi:hypothetical protein